MGSIFGKETVAEPPFQVILERSGPQVQTSYEIRRYGTRFAAEVQFNATGDTREMGEPFRALARYIGVFGTPENEGKQAISMTAPVVTEQQATKMAMTAPVVTENSGTGGKKVMKFILPAEYDEMSKIPKPTNPDVTIEEIPSQVGVVHRYSGSWTEASNRQTAAELSSQLLTDGLDRMSMDHVLDHFQFWGYNPPFTIPMFRRNEIWVELQEAEVTYLMHKFNPTTAN